MSPRAAHCISWRAGRGHVGAGHLPHLVARRESLAQPCSRASSADVHQGGIWGLLQPPWLDCAEGWCSCPNTGFYLICIAIF